MSTKKLQIIDSLIKNADTLDGKHAADFAAASDLEALQAQVGVAPVESSIGEDTIVGVNHNSVGGAQGYGFYHAQEDSNNHLLLTPEEKDPEFNWKSQDYVTIQTSTGTWTFDFRIIDYNETNGDMTLAGGTAEDKAAIISDASGYVINISRKDATGTYTFGSRSMAIGNNNLVSGTDSFAVGENNKAGGANAFVTGRDNKAGYGCMVSGHNNISTGHYCHIEGGFNTVDGNTAHAEGYENTVEESYGHAEGKQNTVSGTAAHAEGISNTASGTAAHAEGYYGVAIGAASHVEGGLYFDNNGNSIKRANSASGDASHAEGLNNIASGRASHAEGDSTTASGTNAHTSGYKTEASGTNSAAFGRNTKAVGPNQMVVGAYNIPDEKNAYAFIIGNGKADDNEGNSRLSNAHTVDWNGNAQYKGNISATGLIIDDTTFATTHTLEITGTDESGNTVTKTITFLGV